MFRSMRRFKQELSKEETIRILEKNSHGVLALSGDEGYPYAVPMSYHYANGCLYFHGAKQGHKMDAIRAESKASFCVVAQDNVVPEKFTTYFISAIAFGHVTIVEDENKKRAILEELSDKYSPNNPEGRDHEINKNWKNICLFQLEIAHMSGKASIEIIRERQS